MDLDFTEDFDPDFDGAPWAQGECQECGDYFEDTKDTDGDLCSHCYDRKWFPLEFGEGE